MYTGELFYETREDIEHLALMEKILDKPLDKAMCERALRKFAGRSSRRKKKSSGINEGLR